MTLGLLVRPDLTCDYLDFSSRELGAHLGGNSTTRIVLAFWPGRANFTALDNADPRPAA